MNSQTYKKLEPILSRASLLLNECSIEAYNAGETGLMLELHPIRAQLSDLIAKITLEQMPTEKPKPPTTQSDG